MNKRTDHQLDTDPTTLLRATVAQLKYGWRWHHDAGFDVLVPPLPDGVDVGDIVFSFADGPYQFVPEYTLSEVTVALSEVIRGELEKKEKQLTEVA